MNYLNYRGRGRRIFFFVLIFLAAIAGLTFAVTQLWNHVLTTIIPVAQISYDQALGLLVLCRLLFGGIRFGSRHGGHWRGQDPALREKFMQMSEEERAAFKQKWKDRCGR